jgi:hypothetical protein
VRYRERVQVPPAWWVLAGLFAASLLLAVGYYLGAGWGIGVTLLALLVAAAIFTTAGLVLEVGPDELRVGRAVIDRRYLGEVRPLDAAATRRRAGVEADARAHLVLRPWVPTAVELTLADPADPVPYWLVSTRRPAALARALQPADDAARPPG